MLSGEGPNLLVCAALVAAGIALHVIKKLYEQEQEGRLVSPADYLRAHPYSVSIMVVSAYLLTAFWYFIGELTYVTAILTGVSANSAFDTLRMRAEAKLRGP